MSISHLTQFANNTDRKHRFVPLFERCSPTWRGKVTLEAVPPCMRSLFLCCILSRHKRFATHSNASPPHSQPPRRFPPSTAMLLISQSQTSMSVDTLLGRAESNDCDNLNERHLSTQPWTVTYIFLEVCGESKSETVEMPADINFESPLRAFENFFATQDENLWLYRGVNCWLTVDEDFF